MLSTLNTGHEIGEVWEVDLTDSFSLDEYDPVNANLVDEGKCDIVTLVEINHVQGLHNEHFLFLPHLLHHCGILRIGSTLRTDYSFFLGEGLLENLLQGLDLSDCVLKLVLGMLQKESCVQVIRFHPLFEEGLET